MMRSNNNHNENLFNLEINAQKVFDATKQLEKYMSLVQNNNRKFGFESQTTLSGEYIDLSLKRSNLVNREAENAFFINVALTGSIFSNVNFSKVKFDEANLQYCQFINTKWFNVKIHSTNLSYSRYYSNVFKNVLFKGSTVAEIVFESCIFENCIITSSMLENTLFSNCIFHNVQFSNTNIEFMEFSNCKYDDVCFPMSQVHYVFGLMEDLLNNKNKIKLSADTQMVSLDEYKTLTESFLIYYNSIYEYFPIANIYLSSGLLEEAYNCIFLGMQMAIKQRNFRMLKFFCKQAKKGNVFPYNKLRKLYTNIENEIGKQSLDVYEQRSLIYNIGEIKSLLLDSIDNLPTVKITLQTNIDSSETTKIADFMKYIDVVINESCTNKLSHIEYRHNSDANFVAFISAHYSEIILTLYFLFKFSNKAIDIVQSKILNHQQIVLNRMEIQEKQNHIEDSLKNNEFSYSVQYIINNTEINNDETNYYF